MATLETSLRSDLWQWIKAIFRHSKSIAGGSGVGLILLVASIWAGGYWLPILGVVILSGSFVCGTFLAWRDERHKTVGKERRSILNKVVELRAGKPPEIFAALIDVSDEFGNEQALEWVCQKLDEQGHVDPFRLICEVFKTTFDGKRLKFLQDARVARIGDLDEALDYFSDKWAAMNGVAIGPPPNR